MSSFSAFTQRHGRRIVALIAVTSIYWVGRLPQETPAERAELSSHFHFDAAPLPVLEGAHMKSLRGVHPSLRNICSWISSVGAGVAINDLDGDGLPNDIVYVDPRTDLVTVTPAPGTGARYQSFALNPAPLPYDTATMAPMGALPGDFNEDGLTDILVYYWGRTPVVFLRSRDAAASSGLTRSSYHPCELVNTGERWFTNAASIADLDGDGHLDLVIGNYFPDGAHILDCNGTGTESMQHSMSKAFNGGVKHLLLWTRPAGGAELAYTDQSGVLDPDVSHGWTLALGCADLDGDMLPEIYFANDFGPDRLLHNRSTPGHLSFALLEGERSLLTPKSKVLGHDSFKGMGVDFADINGDGYPDIYVSNIAGEYALEESHFVWMSTGDVGKMREGIAPYVDRSEPFGLSRSSWGWDTRWCDFDNDGRMEALQATGFVKGDKNRWPELHELAMGNDELLSNPNWWMRCKPGDNLCGNEHVRFCAYDEHHARYYDVAGNIGVGRPTITRGIATADVDGDGRMDFAAASQWDTSYFYHNTSPAVGTFIGLHLRMAVNGAEPDGVSQWPGNPFPGQALSPAIGARATLVLPDGTRRTMQVDGGSGHSGKRSPDLHFGLGSLSKSMPVQLVLDWRGYDGAVHHRTLSVLPGWHTVVFGSSHASGGVS
ncbi:MAG: CRTAC1 family protein [Bacteroidetes bacterium]|nr:CRTAC1 family protein [Bacteroidota bacterium]